jgi:hypothetical protein
MSKKGDATPPTPVDPTVVAGAQTASNQATAQFQSQLNNGNSTTPYGSVTQAQDPTTHQWTSTTALSPSEQGIFNQSQQAQGSALGVANDQIGRVGQALSQGLTPSGNLTYGVQGGPIHGGFDQGQSVQGHVNTPSQQEAIQQAEAASYGHAMNLLQPQMQQASEHQNAQLVAQGLNPNDAAYQNSQTLFNNGQNELLSQAATNAVAQGQGEQQQLYGQDLSSGQFANQAAGQQYGQNQGLAAFGNAAQAQHYGQGLQNAGLNNAAQGEYFNQQAAAQSQPINEFAALMGQGQVQSPTGTGFNPASVAPTDVTGAYALSAQQQQAQYQAKLQQQNSGLTGLYGLGQAAMMFA